MLALLRPLSILFLVAPPARLLADSLRSCSSADARLPVESTMATADILANVRSAEGSLKRESRRLLENALARLDSSGGAVLFTSTPNKYLSPIEPSCRQSYERTKAEPIRYEGRRFKDLDGFDKWIADLAQGKGRDGEDLYGRCGCSPQYKTRVRREGTGYLASAEIVCGPKRDKSDNKYRLATVIERECRTGLKG